MTPTNQPINLPGRMLDAWRDAVLALAKFPRGTKRKDTPPEVLLGTALRQETGAIIDLWESFTKERQQVSRGMLGSAQQTVAYLLGFHLVNAARARLLLKRLSDRHHVQAWIKEIARKHTPTTAAPVTEGEAEGKAEAKSKTKSESGVKQQPLVSWYDLGCGTGAVAHAVSDFLLSAGLPPSALQMRLYDTSGSLLDAASLVLNQAACGASIKTHRVGLERLDSSMVPLAPAGTMHGFSLGYVWNELEKNPVAKTRVLKLLRDQVQGSTLVLLLEPASQTFARSAMELRDEMVKMGYLPLYPCLAPTPCPMLNLSRDWCYSEATWQQPKIMQTLDKSLGISRQHLSGTLMAFATKDLAKSWRAEKTDAVIVGRPERIQPHLLKVKDRPKEKPATTFEYLLCTGSELKKVAPKTAEGAPLQRGLPFSDAPD